MKRLLSYLKHYKFYAVMAPLFKCLEACFELFVPLVVANMIDIGIGNGDMGYIFRMGGLLILLGLTGMLCSFTAQWFSADVAVKTGTSLRNDLLKHIMGLGYAEIDGIGTSTLLTRMTSDINQVQTGVNMFLRLFMRSPFIVFGAVIMAFTVDVKGALIFAVTLPLLVLIVFGILFGTMPLYRKVQTQLDKIMLATRENLLGVRVVRAFGMEEAEKAAFRAENDKLLSLQIFVGKISALLNPLTIIAVNLAIVAILLLGGRQVYAGVLSQGMVIALVNYMSQILVELVKLANLIIIMSKATASMNRIDTIFAVKNPMHEEEMRTEEMEPAERKPEEGSEKDGPAAEKEPSEQAPAREGGGASRAGASALGEAAVEFRDVSFFYPKAKGPSLQNISFSAGYGETIGVIGGTGSGKSTLINLIPRFYDVSGGAVYVGGRDVRKQNIEKLRAKIGVVPQKAVLFAGTLRDNMKWGKADATDEEILRAISVAQGMDIVRKKADGLDTKIEQGGQNLSGGQRQRLTIARAVLRGPDILILDDSASALDFATDAALRKALREETAHTTVFLISQRASTVRTADHILVLEDGRAAGFGTHKELLKSCEVYREICRSQMSEEEVRRDEEA